MKRREAIQLFTAAAATTLAGGPTFAQSQKLRVLIFGGTGFLGPHFVRALQAGGHQVTLFNRGKSNPGLFKDLETLIGDRDGKLDALKGRDWDVVVDDSGYVPRQVKLTADLLKDHIRHYLFISSISVYGTFPKPGLDEDDTVAPVPDAKVEEVTNETYAGLKAGCEQVVESVYGSRAAARCSRPAAPTIRCSTSTCAISQRSCAVVPNSGQRVASMHARHRARIRWAS
jgi:2'-hydroxyisoflavone reductase